MKLLSVLLQASFSGELNTILSSYVKPALIILVLLASIKGVINSVELINDKEERGTTKEGFLKLAIIIAGVALAIVVISVVINKLSAVDLHI